MTRTNFDSLIRNAYYGPKHAGSFSSPIKLYQALRKKGGKTPSLYRIRKWMEKNDNYNLQKPIMRSFRTAKVVVSGKNEQYDVDLADLSTWMNENDGNRYLLIVIDVFSRYLWVEPLKSKTGSEVKKALQKIFNRSKVPEKARSDGGSEFSNREVVRFFKQNGIYHHIARNSAKACYAERVILTIKQKLWRYFLTHRKYRYVDVIQNIVKSYNETPHRSLNTQAPQDITEENSADLWAYLYLKTNKQQSKTEKKNLRFYKQHFMFKIGNFVRISYKKMPFGRGYQQRWTSELFKVKTRFLIQGIPMYKFEDFSGEEIQGNFYQNELTRVNKDEDSLWFIEKKIRKRKKNGKIEWFVKFEGWPDKYNQWVTEQEIKNY